MRGPLRSDVAPTAAYEVRCPRCDVSFPIETKVCVHCGGRTAPPDRSGRVGAVAPDAIDWTDETIGEAPFTIERGPADGVSIETGAAPGTRRESESPGPIVFDPDPDDGAPPTSRSILSSLSGLIWIVLLVAFSIARSCGE